MTANNPWNECFIYGSDGILYWKEQRPITHFLSIERMKQWRSKFAGKPAGTIGLSGYNVVKVFGKLHRVHRVIWEMHYGQIPNGFQIDHINGVRNDNRIENLRLATPSQNNFNMKTPKHNTSGIKGVSWSRSTNKWKAQIKASGHNVRHIGYYNTREEAKSAYDKYVIMLHGEFARTS